MIVIKYVYFGLMFVFLGIIGVCVFFFYLVKKLLEQDVTLDVETDDWGEMEERQPNRGLMPVR